MSELILLLIGAAAVNNLVLTQYLGLCPFMGVSRKLETAIGMALATTLLLTVTSAASHLLFHYLLAPLGLTYLRLLVFIALVAAVAQLTEMVVHRISPLLFQVLGIYLPLIASNCMVLGVLLLNTQESRSFAESVVYGFGAALGFSVVLVLFAAIRERLAGADVPAPFQGPAIALITAALMSLGFLGFAGLVQG